MWMGATLCAVASTATPGAASGAGKIVVLGDSITAGYGLDPAVAYPALLQKKIEADKGTTLRILNLD